MYDSKPETIEHINNVQLKINRIVNHLEFRGTCHDESKLESPEKEIFDKYVPQLKKTKYMSNDYQMYLNEMKKALDHHYENNRHHPEHFENGICGMNLVDIIEMFCDWLASVERTKDGDIYKSIDFNQKRFNYSDDIKSIFENTVKLFK